MAFAKQVIAGYTPAQCSAVGATYPCFRPSDSITRAQMAVLIAQAAAFNDNPSGNQRFTDIAVSHWAYRAIEQGVIEGALTGFNQYGPCIDYSRGPCYYSPNANALRGQIAYGLFAASGGSYNGMFTHATLYPGSDNWSYLFNDGFFHTNDPLIPGGHMYGYNAGSNQSIEVSAKGVQWDYDGWNWLVQNTGGTPYVPAIVFHSFLSDGRTCGNGSWNYGYATWPHYDGFAWRSGSCGVGASYSEIRIFADAPWYNYISQETPYDVYATWFPSGGTSGSLRQINVDNYRMNPDRSIGDDVQNRDFMSKFWFDDNFIYWTP